MLIFCLCVSTLSFAAESDRPIDDATKVRIDQAFGRLPLYFIENQGQVDEKVRYYIQGADRTLYFTETGITFALSKGRDKSENDPSGIRGSSENPLSESELQRYILKLDFAGADKKQPIGQDKQKAVFSYFKSKPEDWHAGCSAFGRLIYKDLWPGIDLVYSGTVNRLKYEFMVKPGADPNRIRLAYRGADALEIKPSGALGVRTSAGGFEDGKPFAYQEIENRRVEVAMTYRLVNTRNTDRLLYGFDVGPYDKTKTLILDPVIIVYCGYVGGDGMDHANGVRVDDDGNAYIGGSTASREQTFPVVVGPDLTHNNNYDAFVAKVSADGTHLIYCGYIGGGGTDEGLDIALDDLGNVYITGVTNTTEASFPVKNGPDLTFNDTMYYDAFVAKVNAQGTDLDYCGYIGGAFHERVAGIDVDSEGRALVAGWTLSSESSFPVKTGPDLSHNGSYDAFVAAVSPDGTQLDYCGYIGGSESDEGHGIALDTEDNAYLTGITNSDESTFPVLVGPDLIHNGGSGYNSHDAWIAKVDKSGAFLKYCGYIGGNKRDDGVDIALDSQGNAYIVGDTRSPRATFPVHVGPDLSQNGDFDAFVAKVEADGSALAYCGYIGGHGYEHSYAITVDGNGNACVAGRTNSPETTFPVVMGPDLTFNGGEDCFVSKVHASGAHLVHSGYLGGIDYDQIHAIALNHLGMIYVAGNTLSNEDVEGFPVSVGPDLTYNGHNPFDNDGFVAKLVLPLVADSQTLSESAGGKVNFFLNAGAHNGGRDYLLLGGVSGIEPGYPLPGGLATLPINFDLLTYTILDLLNTALFTGFLGTLDSFGAATAQLNSPALPPGYVGLKIHFAFCLNDPYDFVSNPLEVEVVE
jgi:hypothetical protein